MMLCAFTFAYVPYYFAPGSMPSVAISLSVCLFHTVLSYLKNHVTNFRKFYVFVNYGRASIVYSGHGAKFHVYFWFCVSACSQNGAYTNN